MLLILPSFINLKQINLVETGKKKFSTKTREIITGQQENKVVVEGIFYSNAIQKTVDVCWQRRCEGSQIRLAEADMFSALNSGIGIKSRFGLLNLSVVTIPWSERYNSGGCKWIRLTQKLGPKSNSFSYRMYLRRADLSVLMVDNVESQVVLTVFVTLEFINLWILRDALK